MLYLVALILPPLAMLMSGKPFQAVVALILQVTLLGWIPATIWALFVVHNHYADVRTQRIVNATKEAARQQAEIAQAQGEAALAVAQANAAVPTLVEAAD